MSMTVRIAIRGVTDLEILEEALREMGITLQSRGGDQRTKGSREVLAEATVKGHRIGWVRNRNRELTMVGDSEWGVMRDKAFQQKLKQQCTLAEVKRKAREHHYHVASVEELEDGTIRMVARAWG